MKRLTAILCVFILLFSGCANNPMPGNETELSSGSEAATETPTVLTTGDYQRLLTTPIAELEKTHDVSDLCGMLVTGNTLTTVGVWVDDLHLFIGTGDRNQAFSLLLFGPQGSDTPIPGYKYGDTFIDDGIGDVQDSFYKQIEAAEAEHLPAKIRTVILENLCFELCYDQDLSDGQLYLRLIRITHWVSGTYICSSDYILGEDYFEAFPDRIPSITFFEDKSCEMIVNDSEDVFVLRGTYFVYHNHVTADLYFEESDTAHRYTFDISGDNTINITEDCYMVTAGDPFVKTDTN